MNLIKALKYLDLSKSTYFYKQNKTVKKKQEYKFDLELEEALLALTKRELTLGYDKVTDYIRTKHKKIWNRKKVYRHMKELKLLQPKKIKTRFIKNRRLGIYCATASNQHWEADLTYVPLNIGNAYLFAVEDVFDKEVVGEHMDLRAGAKQAINSLQQAINNRFKGYVPNDFKLTMRIDRGCQYTAIDFEKFANEHNINLEFCGIQTPNDKPYIESFFSCYKREEVYRNCYENFFEAYQGWKEFIDWYNNLRPHGSLNNLSPRQFQEKISCTNFN